MRTKLLALTLIAMLASPALAAAAPSGTVVVAQGVDPTTLDPQNHQETPAANLATNIFDFLLARDQDLKIVPMLAESYRNVAPAVWEFKLCKGVRFHNGESLDAEAVKFTVEQIVDPWDRGAHGVAPRSLSYVLPREGHGARGAQPGRLGPPSCSCAGSRTTGSSAWPTSSTGRGRPGSSRSKGTTSR